MAKIDARRTAESVAEQKIAKRLEYIMKLVDSLADSEHLSLVHSSQLYGINCKLAEIHTQYDHGRY
jgi:hypothetical protein